MEYGKLQGEVVAAGHVVFTGEIAAAALSGNNFNALGASLISTGLVAVTLGDGIDASVSANLATSDTSPNSVSANNSGLDTDLVKRFQVVTDAGAPVNAGFYFVIVRTAVP